MKFFLAAAILLFSFHPANSQNLTETTQKIRNAFEQREYSMAISELEALEKADRKIFELNNLDYLLARVEEKNGDFARAMVSYQSVAGRNSILKEYALWHLSQIARASGNLMLERTYLQQIPIFSPDSLLKEVVQARVARSYFESKNYDVVIQILSSQQSAAGSQQNVNSSRPPTNNEQTAKFRENQILLGQAFLQSGKVTEARDIFTRLVTNLPNAAQPDDFALAAAKVLDELDGGKENFGKTAPQLSEPEHLKRGAIYQFNRNFPLARLHFQALVERFPNGSNLAFASFQVGRTFAQEGNYTQAIEWFERVQTQFPDDLIAKDALSQLGSAFSRVNKPKEAISRYQKIIEKYPDADNLDRAYLNIIDVLRDAGENSDALKWATKTQEVFKGKLAEALALFVQARIHIAQNDWQNALNDLSSLQNFSDLGGTRVPGGTNKAEITFLKAFALEQLQRYPEAIDVYLSIPDGRNEYYGWRSTERLRALGNNAETKQFIESKLSSFGDITKIPSPDERRINAQSIFRLTNLSGNLELIKKISADLPNYKQIPNFKLLELGRKEVIKEKREITSPNRHQILADELLFLGLYDEAAPELEAAQQSAVSNQQPANIEQNPQSQIPNPKSPDFAYTLAVFYKRGDLANRAVAFIEPFWKNVPADYQIELIPREQLELLYPAPYRDALLKSAPEKGLDPRFLLAIMRQESRYRADVKSNAAARGLMQFISTTSEKLAAELGRTNFRQDELYNPSTAILFGSQYLANLFRLFPNQPQAVAASYNGGEDNMTRWLARSKTDDADRYVAEIVFSQSKDYVYRVMANYRVYQMFYDEKLRAR